MGRCVWTQLLMCLCAFVTALVLLVLVMSAPICRVGVEQVDIVRTLFHWSLKCHPCVKIPTRCS